MSETIYMLQRDLKEARAMTNALVPYIYEKQLYGSVGGGLFGGVKMPSLTIGALILRLRRLEVLVETMTDSQRGLFDAIRIDHERVRSEWNVHYRNKLQQEATSRLKAMTSFFEECEDNPRYCPSIYLPEALRRTIVQEIVRALDTDEAVVKDLKRLLREVDGKLRRFTEPAAFIWAAQIEMVYPPSEFWWLYALPPIVEERKQA